MNLNIKTTADLLFLFTDILLKAEKYMQEKSLTLLLINIDSDRAYLLIDIDKSGEYEYHTISFEEALRLNKAGACAIPLNALS